MRLPKQSFVLGSATLAAVFYSSTWCKQARERERESWGKWIVVYVYSAQDSRWENLFIHWLERHSLQQQQLLFSFLWVHKLSQSVDDWWLVRCKFRPTRTCPARSAITVTPGHNIFLYTISHVTLVNAHHDDSELIYILYGAYAFFNKVSTFEEKTWLEFGQI